MVHPISEDDLTQEQEAVIQLTACAAEEGKLAGVRVAFAVLKGPYGDVGKNLALSIQIVAHLGTAEAVAALYELLKEDFATTGILALNAIRDSGLPVYREIVKESVGARSDGFEVEAGLKALGEIGSLADIEFLEEVPGNTKFDYSDDHSNEWADRLRTKAQEAAARIRERFEHE